MPLPNFIFIVFISNFYGATEAYLQPNDRGAERTLSLEARNLKA